MTKKRICIIAFKPVSKTVHVLRQINYLAPVYDLTVIGHGERDPDWPTLDWHAVPEQTLPEKITKLFWYLPGRVAPFCYDAWFWNVKRHRLAYKYALASGADAFHANDWAALPIAVAAARRTGGRVVFHMHEYAEEERTEPIWRLLVSPAIRSLTKKYAAGPDSRVDASITVCEPIAERYRRELGLAPLVVYNAPNRVDGLLESLVEGSTQIRMIHHGYAKRGRGLERLVHALALTDQRFTLDFMLMPDDAGYIDELKALGERLAPERVAFRAPVPPTQIVVTVAQYDLGLCVIEPRPYNNLMMLPNKFFEYIQAGLAVCVGPSPAMVEVVQRHAVGVVAPTFEPEMVAKTLNRMTVEDLSAMKHAARRAAAVLNADVEMGKIKALYQRLLNDGPQVTRAGTESQVTNGSL